MAKREESEHNIEENMILFEKLVRSRKTRSIK